MRKKYKYIRAIIFLLIILYSLLGFSNSNAIDSFAYALAIGIDKSDTSDFKFTFQFTKATKSSENVEDYSYIYSIDSNSFDSALELLSSYISRPVNLSHCKIIVISEEIASLGIEQHVSTLMNSVEIRPDVSIIISKTNSENFIKNASSKFETLISTYYEMATGSNNYSSYTDFVKLSDFLNKSQSYAVEPYTLLGNIYNTKSTDGNFSTSKVEQSQLNKGSGIEILGLAVFKENKLVGELSAIQTIGHLLVTNRLKTCVVTIENPLNSSESMDLFLYNESSPNIRVEFINNSPFVSIDININAKIMSSSSANNLNDNYFEIVCQELNNYLTKVVEDYLYTISKEYNSDIAGIR